MEKVSEDKKNYYVLVDVTDNGSLLSSRYGSALTYPLPVSGTELSKVVTDSVAEVGKFPDNPDASVYISYKLLGDIVSQCMNQERNNLISKLSTLSVPSDSPVLESLGLTDDQKSRLSIYNEVVKKVRGLL